MMKVLLGSLGDLISRHGIIVFSWFAAQMTREGSDARVKLQLLIYEQEKVIRQTSERTESCIEREVILTRIPNSSNFISTLDPLRLILTLGSLHEKTGTLTVAKSYNN